MNLCTTYDRDLFEALTEFADEERPRASMLPYLAYFRPQRFVTESEPGTIVTGASDASDRTTDVLFDDDRLASASFPSRPLKRAALAAVSSRFSVNAITTSIRFASIPSASKILRDTIQPRGSPTRSA